MTIEILSCGHTATLGLSAKENNNVVTGTGYALLNGGTQLEKICYECAGIKDLECMKENGKTDLYLSLTDNYPSTMSKQEKIKWQLRGFKGKITNWPGTIEIGCHGKRGYHNIARYRFDVWFLLDGHQWHGVQYGEETQIVHCKRGKKTLPSHWKSYQADKMIESLRKIADDRTKEATT